MKRLVLVGEGHGEVLALPALVRKILRERNAAQLLPLYDQVLRTPFPVRWNRIRNQPDYSLWVERIALAAKYSRGGGVLAVFDGDAKTFPAGCASPFCAATAAKMMAREAKKAGAGEICSLAVVFACTEFETWIIAGVDSLAGKSFDDGRPALLLGSAFPSGDPESHGKGWLEKHCPGYRETRDQRALTELLSLQAVRSKNLRSYKRLEHAVEQLLMSVQQGIFVSTPG